MPSLPTIDQLAQAIEAMRDDSRWTFAENTLSGILESLRVAQEEEPLSQPTPGQERAVRNIYESRATLHDPDWDEFLTQ